MLDTNPQEPSTQAADETAEPAGRWAAIVAGVVPLVLGIMVTWQSYGLGLGTLIEPEAGLWPFCLGVALIVMSVGLVIGRERFGFCESFTRGSAPVLIGAMSIAAFVVALPLVGFEIPGVVLLAFWLKVLGGESWRITLIVPIGCVAVFHLLFIELLGVPIPFLFAF